MWGDGRSDARYSTFSMESTMPILRILLNGMQVASRQTVMASAAASRMGTRGTATRCLSAGELVGQVGQAVPDAQQASQLLEISLVRLIFIQVQQKPMPIWCFPYQ